MAMDRRQFLKSAAVAAAGTAVAVKFPKTAMAAAKAASGAKKTPDMAAVRGGEPVPMFRKGIEALGGMQAFVKPGQSVAIKPNASFDATPEYAANTNPELVGEIVRQCLAAGASRVIVFDHTLNNWRSAYRSSGIEAAVRAAGGVMLPANEERDYEPQSRSQAGAMREAKVFRPCLESDVVINVPVLKNHGGTKMTSAIKNLMGTVWDRRIMHRNNLPQSIADGVLYVKPQLNVVDAYRVMTANGPRGVSLDDVELMRHQIISTDIVAADVASARLMRYRIRDIPYIEAAERLGLGTSNLDKLDIVRLEV